MNASDIRISAAGLEELFRTVSGMRVGVIGDLMLDTYMWGKVERISPEAPVPVVSVERKEYRIGGAGNVALNLQSLGARVSVFSVIGEDEDGAVLRRLLESSGIDTGPLCASPLRMTTNKIRVIGRNQQMMRLDHEVTDDLPQQEEDRLLASVKSFLSQPGPCVLVFEDYNKGVLTEQVIRESVRLAGIRGALTAVDPKRRNFFAYEGVDIFKPNLKEAREGLHLLDEPVAESALESIHLALHGRLGHRISFITLSEKGVFYHDGQHMGIIPSHLRNVADVSGAGDTVIAVAALVYAATKDVALMAAVANIAGGLVCEEVGTVAIRRSLLLDECKRLLV